ncbi:two-component sensor histidine kinase [Flavobacterium circumlabens]|uniref:histidine kinase n=1 Tax=Flavobacterium circumlabens TaxID=2133765 RepID=A0A4Y7UI10_9FLAO|nr:ATP-binding protein [Flavobacterium circumlabens]TCN60916.1 histidine kinase/DNA gyrase B/HSP90-like ATPase [Flavobacterium circumlabens]TEB46034.1 two-component sensor histidine kinase [Flavobacterium circumlabens]
MNPTQPNTTFTDLALLSEEKTNHPAELILANKKLAQQIEDRGKRAAELVIANTELAFQNKEKEKRAAELVIANNELAFQNKEKEKRAAELVIANRELAFQNKEKEKRAAELLIANIELTYQNEEKEKRAAELIVANKELAFQNREKEKRAAELVIANSELAFQNKEKEKRAAELVIANSELAFQNKEKEKRATELLIANIELTFQNKEKEQRAAELILANTELAFQNEEKEKQAAALLIANKELDSFTYISSHHLQEPLRKIQVFSNRILTDEHQNLSTKGQYYFKRTEIAAARLQTLLNDLLTYSQTNSTDKKFVDTNLNTSVQKVLLDLKDDIAEKKAIVEVSVLGNATVIPLQFKELLKNLICNSLKFSRPGFPPHIIIKNHIEFPKLKDRNQSKSGYYAHISISDNGIGFDPQFKDRIFELFQCLHTNSEYEGTGIGLAIVKKIVQNHNGIITTTSEINKGARFDIYIPVLGE